VWVSLEGLDEMSRDAPKSLVIPNVIPEGGMCYDPEEGAICVVLVVSGKRVELVCNVDVVHGQKLLKESGQKAESVCEDLIWGKVEVPSSRLKCPFGEIAVGVVAAFEDVAGDGLAAGDEDIPRGCRSKDLFALSVQREDRDAAASTWIEKLLLSLNGGREFVVWVLSEGQHEVDCELARRCFRDFDLDLRLEPCSSCDKPLAKGGSKVYGGGWLDETDGRVRADNVVHGDTERALVGRIVPVEHGKWHRIGALVRRWMGDEGSVSEREASCLVLVVRVE
jgi:hypothetical protein